MSDDKPVTGPTDDEEYGHGGVEVPPEHLESLPQVQADEEDADAAPGDEVPGWEGET